MANLRVDHFEGADGERGDFDISVTGVDMVVVALSALSFVDHCTSLSIFLLVQMFFTFVCALLRSAQRPVYLVF